MSNDMPQSGIRFHVASSSYRSVGSYAQSKGTHSKFTGTVDLTATFDREELWEDIIRRLEGLVLHRGGDIQSELIEILQGKVDLLEQELAERGTVDRQRAQRAENEASMASADKVRAEGAASLLKAQLEMKTRELVDAENKVAAWQDWHAKHQPYCPVR